MDSSIALYPFSLLVPIDERVTDSPKHSTALLDDSGRRNCILFLPVRERAIRHIHGGMCLRIQLTIHLDEASNPE